MPNISVIIPAYNRAYIIKEAIDSILDQSYTDLEILVIDDGSTDNTKEVVESIDDDRIKYIYKENGGVSSARNTGIANSYAQFVAFLDTDDLWPKNFLQDLLNELQNKPEYGLAYCPTNETLPDGTLLRQQDTSRCVSGHITKQLFKNSFIWPMAVLIRKSILENFSFDENLKTSDDNDGFLRLSVRSPFVFVPDIIVTRRTSPDSHAREGVVENSCNRAISLERFYFQMNGDKYVTKKLAKKKLSKVYNRAARRNTSASNRTAAICLYKKAIAYCPYDIKLYKGLFAALLINKNKDNAPGWKMPEPLKAI